MSIGFDPVRTILAISGEDRLHFLQGLLTQDVTKLADEKIQFAALLSPQGKILHDVFLIADGERILVDTPALSKDILMKRLAMYKLRAKVVIADMSDTLRVGYSTTAGLADPRHPELPHRVYAAADAEMNISPDEYYAALLQLGIPDSTRDFGPDEIVPMDAGYDLLHAISFTKGCYVGQEITARMHYKNIARRGFYRLNDAKGNARLALIKFEDIEKSGDEVIVDNMPWHATLPAWLKPKYDQFLANRNNQ